jgi:predicted CXXCH cytochrome family protein
MKNYENYFKEVMLSRRKRFLFINEKRNREGKPLKKLSFGLLFAFVMIGFLATTAFANATVDPTGGNNVEINAAPNVGNLNPNANGTGSNINDNSGDSFKDVIKSTDMINHSGVVGDQKSHGSYQNNTNSCASCHQTHTAKADKLLFANSTFQTCSSCHDGTLGFYNVFANGDAAGTAGTFGGTHTGNMSVHLATGALKVKAAPGGKATDAGSWGSEFNCASCHAPHGSYSGRLLHYNPNNMGNTPIAEGGLKAAMIDVVEFGSTGWNTGLKAVRGTKAQLGLTGAAYNSIPDFVDAGNTIATKVVMIYNNGTKTTNPWLYGYGSRASGATQGGSHAYMSRLFTISDPSTIITSNGTIALSNVDKVIDHLDYNNGGFGGTKYEVGFKYDKGLVYAANQDGQTLLNGALKADVGRAYVANLKLDPIPGAVSNVVTKHDVPALWGTGGGGVGLSEFCKSCHTDYMMAGSNGGQTGVGVQSVHGNYNGERYFGHTTTSSTYTCLRCHYAHGTDVEIMVDAMGDNIRDLQKPVLEGGKGWDEVTAKAYMLDKNPSSALKKFTNMSGCWSCHNSSSAASLKNTNRDAQHPNGMFTDPSKK